MRFRFRRRRCWRRFGGKLTTHKKVQVIVSNDQLLTRECHDNEGQTVMGQMMIHSQQGRCNNYQKTWQLLWRSGRMVASDTCDTQFKSSHWQFYKLSTVLIKCMEKTKRRFFTYCYDHSPWSSLVKKSSVQLSNKCSLLQLPNSQ